MQAYFSPKKGLHIGPDFFQSGPRDAGAWKQVEHNDFSFFASFATLREKKMFLI